ncbi:LysR family transcriptional regulator [Burkholderia sp. Bp9125]|nr:LysR family transcriptional regulator [Burkholderia sp. Bp9125]
MKAALDAREAFAAVVDTGSITAGAQSLDLTVSATSRSPARFEEKLKTTLPCRTRRRLELTEEGRAFLREGPATVRWPRCRGTATCPNPNARRRTADRIQSSPPWHRYLIDR